MISLYTMINQLHGMVGTDDLTEWESKFMESVYDKLDGKSTTYVSSKQADVVEKLYKKHFKI